MAVAVSAIRSLILSHLETELGAGWRASPWLPDLLGREPRAHAHRAYAVAVGRQEVEALDRQSRHGALTGRRVQARTALRVSLLWSIRLDDQSASYQEALDGLDTLIAAVRNVPTSTAEIAVHYTGVDERRWSGTESQFWLVQGATFVVHHTQSLEAP